MSSIDVAAARLAADRFGLVARDELYRAGVSQRTVARRLTSGVWTEPVPRVIQLPGHPCSWPQSVLALVLAGAPDAVASHRTAAFLHGLLDVPQPQRIDVLVTRGCHTETAGVNLRTSHWVPATDRAEIGGIPVTACARTVLDTAVTVRLGHLETLVSDAIRRRLTTPAQLWRCLDERPGVRGCRRLRYVLQAMHDQAAALESPLEGRALQLLREAGLPPPELQRVIADAGQFVARVDLAYPDHRVAIECDGAAYHSSPSRRLADAERETRLRHAGWQVIRITSDDLRIPGRAAKLAEIVRALTTTPPDRGHLSQTEVSG